ncbi:MAG: Gfo/Idh/MocA family oxidoreductase [Armatimonadetes bacterium]|nr:Gfo/Idh/MocA family oxidoreductase [Armatimonadota bacterium]
MSMTLGVYLDDNPHTGGHSTDISNHPEIGRVIFTGSEEARERAETIARAEYAPDAWEELIADPAVDALMVLTNNRDAGRLSLQAVEGGKYVYCEKPGARCADDMAKIVDACAATGAHFVPCYCRRTHPDAREIKRLIEAGAIGELWSFQAAWITSTAAARGPGNWFFDKEIAGGGILYWLGCHWIDQLKFVTGRRVAAVSAMVNTVNPDISVEDVACLSMRLEGGAIGTLRVGYLIAQNDGYDENDLMTAYEGSQGSISHRPGRPGKLTLRTRAEGFWEFGERRDMTLGKSDNGYAPLLLTDFLHAARDRRAPLVTAEDAYYVLRVAEAAYESSRTGAQVELEW